MADRVDDFLRDVLGSPDALEAALGAPPSRAAAGLIGSRPVLLAGLGSSRFAALEALPHLRAAGIDARVELASVAVADIEAAATDRPADAATVLVAISNSGSTREVAELARRWPGPVVAVVGRDGPVAEAATVTIRLAGVAEISGVACQSYRATLVALLGLAEPDAGRLRPSVAALHELIAGHAAWIGPAADLLDGGDELHVIGAGARAGTLEQAALMLREAPRIPALATDAGDWLHVALYTVLPGSRALVLAGTPYDADVGATIAARGGRAVAIGGEVPGAAVEIGLPRAAADSRVRSLVESVAVELIAAELWRRASARPVDEAR